MISSKGKILVIVGSPASGKTFLAEKLAPIYDAKIIYSHPNNGLPVEIQYNLANQSSFFETLVWFRNLQVSNYRLALLEASRGKNIILDSPYYQNQLFIDLYISIQYQRDILYQIGNLDHELLPSPDCTIYISSTPESIERFLKMRYGMRYWENQAWYTLMGKIPPIIENYMSSISSRGLSYIKIDRNEYDFSLEDDVNRLLNLITNRGWMY